jgi:flagellar basal body rod protein FlgG
MSGGPESLRAAGLALGYWQRRSEVVTHNLANAETAGFRGQKVFSEMLADGVPRVGTRTDTREGALQQTGSPLDLALRGEGFLVVRSDEGEQLVRTGSFTLDREGRVLDPQGRELMADNGPLVLPPGPVEIDTQGRVMVAGVDVGRLRVELASPATAAAQTPGRGRAVDLKATGAEVPIEARSIRQGYLEDSNVQALESLVELAVVQRSFDAVQNSVRVLDEVFGTAVNRLGRVG